MKIIELNGTPRQRGQQHGEELRREIHQLAEIRHYLLRKFLKKMHPYEIEKIAYDQVEKLNHYTDLFEEFCGIADGANLTLTELAILNNYTDMRDFSYDPEEMNPDAAAKSKTSLSPDGDGGCSVFSHRSSQHYVCGQTWDMHASAIPHVVHLRIKGTPESEGGFNEIFTVSGCLGLSGTNSQGVSVFINNLHCSETSIGLMWPALVRGMLTQESASTALEFLKEHMPCSGHNYLICDPKESINVETTGRRVEITNRFENKRSVFHTNHYLGSLASIEIKARISQTTQNRYKTLERYFSNLDREVDFDALGNEVLGSRIAKGIDIPKPSQPHASATCGGILVDMNAKKGLTYLGGYTDLKHFHFQW